MELADKVTGGIKNLFAKSEPTTQDAAKNNNTVKHKVTSKNRNNLYNYNYLIIFYYLI